MHNDTDEMLLRLSRGENVAPRKGNKKAMTVEKALIAVAYVKKANSGVESRYVPNKMLMYLTGWKEEQITLLRSGSHWVWFELERQGYRFNAWAWRNSPQGSVEHWLRCRDNELEELKNYGLISYEKFKKRRKKARKLIDEYRRIGSRSTAARFLREMYGRKLVRAPIAKTLAASDYLGFVEWESVQGKYLSPVPVSANASYRKIAKAWKRVDCNTRKCTNKAMKGWAYCGKCKPEQHRKQKPSVLQALESRYPNESSKPNH